MYACIHIHIYVCIYTYILYIHTYICVYSLSSITTVMAVMHLTQRFCDTVNEQEIEGSGGRWKVRTAKTKVLSQAVKMVVKSAFNYIK